MSVQGPWLQSLFTGWLTGKTVKAMLLSGSSSFASSNANISTLTELVAAGYTAGGLVVTPSVAYDTTNQAINIVISETQLVYPAESTSIGGVAYYDVATGVVIAIDAFGPINNTGTGGLTYLITGPILSGSFFVPAP